MWVLNFSLSLSLYCSTTQTFFFSHLSPWFPMKLSPWLKCNLAPFWGNRVNGRTSDRAEIRTINFKMQYLPGALSQSFVWGDKCMGTQIHLPPKSSLSSDFNHFILKLLENAKFVYVSRKKYWNILISGGRPLLIFNCGDASPVPQLLTLMISAQILPIKPQDQHQPIHRVPVNGSNTIVRFFE